MSGWIGVDLDGTLAEYHGWDERKIGAPIPAMVERVKEWLEAGQEVRIMTARVSMANRDKAEADAQRGAIAQWCLEYIGAILFVTCEKDYGMIELWDDRCHRVEVNTGRLLA